jgi:hypothetical protein
VGRISTMAFSWSWFTDSSFIADYIFDMILDSWIFYLIILVFGVLAFYLMDVGIFK